MEENLELEQGIDVEVEDTEDFDIEEDAEETEEIDNIDDEELEYDEDGNVIETESEDNEAATQIEEREINETDNKVSPPADNSMQKKYDEREAVIKDALKALGIEASNVEEGLLRLAADATGMSVEDYAKQRNENRKLEEAQRVYKEVMLERMVQQDLNDLHTLFPETKSITKFEDIPNAKRYAELRDKGLSAKEAYSAANADARREVIANSVKQQTINASKSHLKSNVPIASKDTSIKISRGEMEQMRELFPDKSDKELVALYKKTR